MEILLGIWRFSKLRFVITCHVVGVDDQEFEPVPGVQAAL